MGGRAIVALLACTIGVVGVPVAVSAQTEVHDGAPVCGVAESGVPPTAVDDGVLRVATYNILHSQGDYDDETMDRRIELVAEALADSGADVVGMQEVVASANHGLVAQRVATQLRQKTSDDWSWCFFRSNPHVPGEVDTGPGGVGGPFSQAIAELARGGDSPWSEGVAIVSRFPIEEAATHRLAPRAAEAPVCQAENPDKPLATPTCAVDTRQVLWAAVDSPCGVVDFFSTHLANDESSASETTRQVQVADALVEIGRRATESAAPDVFVGDFNTLESGPVWQAVIEAGFVDGYRSVEPDAPGLTSGQDIDTAEATVTRRIDFVFARPGDEPLRLGDAEVIGDAPSPFAGSGGQTVVWPSDHYGVAVSVLSGTACTSGSEPGGTPTSSPAVDPAPVVAAAVDRLPATGRENQLGPLVALVFLGAAAIIGRRAVTGRSGPPSA